MSISLAEQIMKGICIGSVGVSSVDSKEWSGDECGAHVLFGLADTDHKDLSTERHRLPRCHAVDEPPLRPARDGIGVTHKDARPDRALHPSTFERKLEILSPGGLPDLEGDLFGGPTTFDEDGPDVRVERLCEIETGLEEVSDDDRGGSERFGSEERDEPDRTGSTVGIVVVVVVVSPCMYAASLLYQKRVLTR